MYLVAASLIFGLCFLGGTVAMAYLLRECNRQMCEVMKLIAVLKAAPDVHSALMLKRLGEEKKEVAPKEKLPTPVSPDELKAEALANIRKQQSPNRK